jgi:hypothetical protein
MSAKPEGRPEPVSSKLVVSPAGQARLTLVFFESDVMECDRCPSSHCRQKVKTIDAELGLVKCAHEMPVAQVAEFRYGTPAGSDQTAKMMSNETDDGVTFPFSDSGDAYAIDEAADVVFAAIRAQRAADYVDVDDHDDDDDDDLMSPEYRRVCESLETAIETVLLVAEQAGVCVTDDNIEEPIVVESERHSLIFIPKDVAKHFRTADEDLVIPIEKTSMVRARAR